MPTSLTKSLEKKSTKTASPGLLSNIVVPVNLPVQWEDRRIISNGHITSACTTDWAVAAFYCEFHVRVKKKRRRYYDLFSHFYDAFIRIHARRDEYDTRYFLVDASYREKKPPHTLLDICCGTGSVILAFAERYADALLVGCDFSSGMLRRAQKKNVTMRAGFVEGDAAELPFRDESFDIVTFSHALYELKGPSRTRALMEMQRVLQPDGLVLLMEHEVPENLLIKVFFNLSMRAQESTSSNNQLPSKRRYRKPPRPRDLIPPQREIEPIFSICRRHQF